jgi:ADP-ribosylglycohydrolase
MSVQYSEEHELGLWRKCMSTAQITPLMRAQISLEGLSVGDAFGEFFLENPELIEEFAFEEQLPTALWPFTDDTNMALSIYEQLRLHQSIKQDELAQSFAKHYHRDRRYSAGAAKLLRHIQSGGAWRELSENLFGENGGSYGNGAAMRIAPLGAYFAHDPKLLVEQAQLSSEITHSHIDAVHGGIAVALAAAWAWRIAHNAAPNYVSLLDLVIQYMPEGEMLQRIKWAKDVSPGAPPRQAAQRLGNGSRISAIDTVPFTLWCASSHLNSYSHALWATVTALGDIDTNCAIVGGIVALATGLDSIPAHWRTNREPLPAWPFEEVA